MKKAYWETALGIAIAAAIFCCGLALGFIINRLPAAPGDAATWAGALLAGLAFGGTIWIATSERRSRENRARAIAVLRGADIHSQLNVMCEWYKSLKTVIDQSTQGRGGIIQRFHERAIVMPIWKIDSLVEVLVIPNNVARDLATAVKMHELIVMKTGWKASQQEIHINFDENLKQILLLTEGANMHLTGIKPRLEAFLIQEGGFRFAT